MRNRGLFPWRSALVAATAVAVLASPAAAQESATHRMHEHEAGVMPTTGVRAELIRDIDSLEDKYLSLAQAMRGKYEWRPGEGVRSVSEVLMHVAGANFMLPSLIGIAPPEDLAAEGMPAIMARMEELERVTDPAEVESTMRRSFDHARQAIAAVPEGELDASVDLFGHPSTKRAALSLLVNHMHEHLGQSVAYARVNGVVPPWSRSSGG